MVASFKILLKRNAFISSAALLTGYILLAIVALKDYLSFQSLNFLLGLLALSFTLQTRHQHKRSYRFAWAAFICMILCFLMPVNTLLYFTIAFALFFLIESFYAGVDVLAIFIIGLMSPLFKYFVGVFSFPIRLKLTELAGIIFNAFSTRVEVMGNTIVYKENEFSVDPGCMGLSMMEASLLLGIMLVCFFQKKFQRKLNRWKVLLYLGMIVGLNIIANLARIILLVQFSILPDTASHELVGLICLAVYVFLPAVWMISFFIKSAPLSKPGDIEKNQISRGNAVSLALLTALCFLSVRVAGADTYRNIASPALVQAGNFTVTSYAPGILKLLNPHALVYIKYIRGFYDADHNPMICWKGSGYVFEQVQKDNIEHREIYTGLLVKGQEKLYSAWWYDNGVSTTINQFEWRWDMLNGAKNYSVINVTCSSRQELRYQVKQIFAEKTLSRFF